MGGQERPREPGSAYSFALAVGMHLALALFLFFGVRWNTEHPAPMVAELYSELPEVQQPQPTPPPPKPEPPKPEPPKPEPPKPEPKPKVQPPKPDIALEDEKKKKEEARKKAEDEKRKKDEDEKKLKREMQQAHDKRLLEELRDIKPQPTKGPLVGQPTPGDPFAKAGYVDKIRAKIRGNIIMPPDIPGNPEAQFDVRQLPTGEVISVKLRQSSGVKSYDEAVERAIWKSSPLPKPDKPGVFEPDLGLKFRPVE